MKSIFSTITAVLLLSAAASFGAEVKPGVLDTETGSFTFTPVQEPQELASVRFVPEQTIVLTDAETLADWDNGEGKPTADWEIQDGIIRRTGGKEDLFYKGDYENFILEFEFQISKEGNSGVFYYAWFGSDRKARGYEYQIIDDVHRRIHPEMERFSTGGLYAMYHRFYNAGPMILDGYNKGKIVVFGNHIEHWLNGKLAVSVQVGTENWKAHVAQSRLNEDSRFGKMKTGRIAFQNHNHPVFFRNVRLTTYKKVTSETGD